MVNTDVVNVLSELLGKKVDSYTMVNNTGEAIYQGWPEKFLSLTFSDGSGAAVELSMIDYNNKKRRNHELRRR